MGGKRELLAPLLLPGEVGEAAAPEDRDATRGSALVVFA
jgi:hypothetical protein